MANEITVEGIFRVVFADRRQTNRPTVWESHTAPLKATEKINQTFIAPGADYADEDDKIMLEFVPDADVTIDETSVIQIPFRYLNKATGKPVDTTLTAGNFGLTAAVACVAGVPNVIGTMSVAAQECWSIGHKLTTNSQVYVQLRNTA